MHPRVLKEIAGEITNALVVIYQNSLDSGVVPADWKTANVTPLFKKGKGVRCYNPCISMDRGLVN